MEDIDWKSSSSDLEEAPAADVAAELECSQPLVTPEQLWASGRCYPALRLVLERPQTSEKRPNIALKTSGRGGRG
eukprot:3898774-Pyramimonas_sp.AAC.1